MQEIIGQKTTLKNIFQTIDNLIKADPFYLLISGEQGTGKEILAQYVFSQTKKSNLSLIEINCLEANNLNIVNPESKMILFFREIENLSKKLQETLLSLINNHQNKFSIIASANSLKMAAALNGKKFNRRLYQKLSITPVCLPPLRERCPDLKVFVDIFIARVSRSYVKNIQGISAAALTKLKNYAFPGNISELKTIIRHAVLLEDSSIVQAENILIKSPARKNTNSPSLRLSTDKEFKIFKQTLVSEGEAFYVASLLEKHRGSVVKAAAAAKLLRPAFSRLMQKYQIKADNYKCKN